MRFDILTIFPNFFRGPLDHGILNRAIAAGTVQVVPHDLRAFTHDRHRTVDDRPFGGGEGMVLKPQPIFECVESLEKSLNTIKNNINYIDTIEIGSNRSIIGIAPKSTRDTTRQSVILLSAQGRPFTQSTAHHLATLDRVVLICGRYEGVDERVSDLLADQEISIGDYVLSGGELAAAVVLDATVRLLPGVLGHADSNRFESFGPPDEAAPAFAQPNTPTHPGDSPKGNTPTRPNDPAEIKIPDGVPRSTHGSGGILDYPHYTRPADFRGSSIPEVLAAGDHLAIRRWRRHAALAKTLRNRPDLLAQAPLSDEDRAFLSTLEFPNAG